MVDAATGAARGGDAARAEPAGAVYRNAVAALQRAVADVAALYADMPPPAAAAAATDDEGVATLMQRGVVDAIRGLEALLRGAAADVDTSRDTTRSRLPIPVVRASGASWAHDSGAAGSVEASIDVEALLERYSSMLVAAVRDREKT